MKHRSCWIPTSSSSVAFALTISSDCQTDLRSILAPQEFHPTFLSRSNRPTGSHSSGPPAPWVQSRRIRRLGPCIPRVPVVPSPAVPRAPVIPMVPMVSVLCSTDPSVGTRVGRNRTWMAYACASSPTFIIRQEAPCHFGRRGKDMCLGVHEALHPCPRPRLRCATVPITGADRRRSIVCGIGWGIDLSAIFHAPQLVCGGRHPPGHPHRPR